MNALHLSIVHNHLHIVEMLLNRGANIEQWAKFSTVGTPLHLAISHGHTVIAYKLLKVFHANIEGKDINGLTPLHVACKTAHYDIAFLLIEMNADCYVKSLNQKSPFDLVVDPIVKDKLVLAAERACAERNRLKIICEEKEKEQRYLQEQLAIENERLERIKAEKMQHIEHMKNSFIERLRLVCGIRYHVALNIFRLHSNLK
jgi:hypothetical protein